MWHRHPKAFWTAIVVLSIVGLALAGGGFIQPFPPNSVSCPPGSTCSTDDRWEPSSSTCPSFSCPGNTSWVHSWFEFNANAGFTASWNGGQWTKFSQGLGTFDHYLTWNPVMNGGVHNLVMIAPNRDLQFRASTDASGSNWGPQTTAATFADYPSVAVASNGTIVAVYNQGSTFAVVSTNGGQNWSSPVIATSDSPFGRIVASGNIFHVIFVDAPAFGDTWVLKRRQCDNGINSCTMASHWSAPVTLDTFTRPIEFSPDNYCSGSNCGRIFYATTIFDGEFREGILDAAGAPGLGWVVIYAAKREDVPSISNLKYCIEAAGGCGTISHDTDLFQAGIATSNRGDLWVNFLTYSTLSRSLPLLQVAGYRQPNGIWLPSAVIRNDIDPTQWKFDTSNPQRCQTLNCFRAGDYMKPTANGFTGATIPYILQSPQKNDLTQTFAQDPQQGQRPPSLPGLVFGPILPFGRDSTTKLPLPPSPKPLPNTPRRRGPY